MHQLVILPIIIMCAELFFCIKGQSSIAKLIRCDQNALWEIASFVLTLAGIDYLILILFTCGFIENASLWAKQNSGILTLLDSSLLHSIFLFIAFDFIVYWIHRLEHASNWFWLAHKFHHSVQELTVLSSTRSHPLHSLFRIKVLMIYFFGIAITKNYVFVFHLFVNLFAHSRLDTNLGIVGKYLFITPRFHYKHHDLNDNNCNYSNGLVIWDRIFHTYREGNDSIYSIKCGVPSSEVNLSSITHSYISPFIDFILWPFKRVYRFTMLG